MLVSNCCSSDVRVESGGCTAYYACRKCNKPCQTRSSVGLGSVDDDDDNNVALAIAVSNLAVDIVVSDYSSDSSCGSSDYGSSTDCGTSGGFDS